MMRGLLERRAEHQHALDRFAGRDFDGEQPCAADRQRPGLVEQHGMGARQRFQRAAALDQNAAPRGLRDAGDEGDRGGQDQRTRRRGDQHGEAADHIVRDQPGDQRRCRASAAGTAARSDRRAGRTAPLRSAPPSPAARCRHRCWPRPPPSPTIRRPRPAFSEPESTAMPRVLHDRDGLAGQRGLVDRRGRPR